MEVSRVVEIFEQSRIMILSLLNPVWGCCVLILADVSEQV